MNGAHSRCGTRGRRLDVTVAARHPHRRPSPRAATTTPPEVRPATAGARRRPAPPSRAPAEPATPPSARPRSSPKRRWEPRTRPPSSLPLDAASAAAPADIKPAVDTVISETRAGNPGSPAFTSAYLEITDFAIERCGFGEVAVSASDHAFAGLADTLDAGPVVVELDNTGTEFHQLMIMRLDEGVTVDDLLALPEDQIVATARPVGGAFAAPGETGSGMLDLDPGRDVAICFLPTGATPENMPKLQSGELNGVPHHTQGMVQEVTVS